MNRIFYSLIVLLSLNSCGHGFVSLDLNGADWMVTEHSSDFGAYLNPIRSLVDCHYNSCLMEYYANHSLSGSPGVKTKGSVPGSMYTALYNSGKLPDPLYRDNDVKFAWLGQADWAYSRTFTVSSEVASAKRALLVCEGLDTIATVIVNGKVVGYSDNMFLPAQFDVTGILKVGDNSIIVSFQSAVKEALARANRSSYVIPPNCPPAEQNGQCHVNQIRKEQCSFSWDWGPSFPTQGIWKPIHIDAFSSAIISDLTAVVKKEKSQWQVVVEVYFEVVAGSEVTGQLNARVPGLNLTFDHTISVSSSKNVARIVLFVPSTTDVPLWWPNGYGAQRLFDLNVTFTSSSDMSQRSVKIGFRTVELVQDPVSNNSNQGLSFYFKINGLPVFLKGTNWIPADSFQERITVQQLRFLLESAKNVSINSMRVWGGGVYESDEFYQLCDELGIMVWQDLMFSVALYPTYKEFLDSVANEVTYQLRRMKHHPSIIIWSGNNENEKGLRQDWFNTASNYTLYYNDYVKLYVKTIMPIIQQEDDSRDYIVSSPSDGKESEEEGYVAKDPGSELYGDIHFYDYAADQWNASAFRIPRMASEYGVQAWCNNESLANVFLPQDFNMNSSMVNHRQHHPEGNMEMEAEVGMHMVMPSSSDDKANFVDFIYLTQINQAMSIRTQTEHYRRHQSELLSDGRGLTMGALYWQLNDIWQAPTWASIDYEGAWKMLHYFARKFFAPYLVSPYLSDADTLQVYIVVDEVPSKEVRTEYHKRLSFHVVEHIDDLIATGLPMSEVKRLIEKASEYFDAQLVVQIYNYNNFTALKSWKIPFQQKTTAQSVLTREVSELLSESGCPSKQDCLLYVAVTDVSGWLQFAESWLPLDYPKSSNLKPANVRVTSITMVDPYTFDIALQSDSIALFVWLNTDTVKGVFSDNGFLMLAPTKSVHFTAREKVIVSQLKSQLKVISIADVQNKAKSKHS